MPEGWGGCLVQQAGGRDAEHGRKLLQDADAGVARAAFELAQVNSRESGLEAHMLLRPLSFCSEHSQIAGKAVSNFHAPIAPEASFKSSNYN